MKIDNSFILFYLQSHNVKGKKKPEKQIEEGGVGDQDAKKKRREQEK